MTPFQAIDFFESRRELAAVCNVSETAVHYWVKKGWIPYDKQCLIQVEAQRRPTKRGKTRLQASWYDVPKERRRAA